MLLVDAMVFTVIPCEFIVIHSESMRRWTYQKDQMMVVTIGTILITVNIPFCLEGQVFPYNDIIIIMKPHDLLWYMMVYIIYNA